MTAYTPGRPVANGNGIHIGTRCLATTDMEPYAQRVADARRIAACWNACAEIETDTLEELGQSTSLAKIAARAIEQRGDLLVALQNLIGLARMGAAPLKDYKAALAVADAAIQKATNKEQA